jgi:uncharacterized membrane protein
MARNIRAETTRSLPARYAAGIMIAAVAITGMVGASANAEDRHGGGNRGGDHRDGGGRRGGGDRGYSGYSGGYYSPPPVVYGSPYGYGYPPPVVYGPTVGIAMPGVNIGIR